METTTRKYSTGTYEYYKNMIDFEIGWLQFLLSFGRIKNNTSFDLESRFELIKMELIEGIETFIDSNPTNKAQDTLMLMRSYIEDILKKEKIKEAIPYINRGMSERDKNDLILLLYVRRFVKSIRNDLMEIQSTLTINSDSDIRVVNSLITELIKLYPEIYLESEDFGDSFMDFFAGELGLSFSKDGSGQAYIYMVLSLLDRIDAYLRYMLPSEYTDSVSQVSSWISEFDSQTYLDADADYDITTIINACDGLRNNITLFKKALTDISRTNGQIQKKELKES